MKHSVELVDWKYIKSLHKQELEEGLKFVNQL